MAIRDRIAALLGISTFRPPSLPSDALPNLDSESVETIRRAHGGQLALTPISKTRWYLKDLESAELAADTGDISHAARVMRQARKDGIYSGVLSTRTGGLVRLPKRFRGDPEIIKELEKSDTETRGVFDELVPSTELALLAADGLELGVGVAELVPVVGRSFPILVRLDPEFLYYQWHENRWYYRSIAGTLPITPGDGRWVLHMPGGRVAPWHHGLWRAIGRAYIRKEHANLHKDNWESKLANSARVAVAPQGASEPQKDGWFRAVMAWGVNTVFGLTPGYDVRLLESNGRGYQSFRTTIADQNEEMIIAVAGQTVTTDGGAGFSNSDVHKSIRADLIKETADGLAYTVNTQVLPSYVIDHHGEDALTPGVVVEWDVTPPKDRNSEASAMSTIAQAMTALTSALEEHELNLDARAVALQFGIPISEPNEDESSSSVPEVSLAAAIDLARARGMQPTEAAVRVLAERAGLELELAPVEAPPSNPLPLAPSDVAKLALASEGRASLALAPFGDERDKRTIAELGAEAEAGGDVTVVEAEAAADVELEESFEAAE